MVSDSCYFIIYHIVFIIINRGATRSLANNLHRKAHDSDLELTDNDSAEDESELQLKLWHEWEFDRRVNHNKYL